MASEVSILDVRLYGRHIGTLTRLGGDRIVFAFASGYIEDGGRPTLSLSFKDTQGNLIVDVRPTQTRVPPFFANLLPEGPLREYLARRAGVSERHDFYLLWVLGRDLPGAVQITPVDGDTWPPSESDAGTPAASHAHPEALRFSLAGVQLKFSAVLRARGGLTIPAEGVGGSWIVKLPSSTYEAVPENEFSMMTLAKHVGIEVPDVALYEIREIRGLPDDIGGMPGRALAVRRFDRTPAGPVHIEDFAQIFGVYPERKYERASYRSLARVIWTETGEQGLAEYVRRLTFNALIGNADMHLKNWSLIYPDRRTPALAPAYDFVATIAFLPDEKMALTFGHSKRWTDLSLAEMAWFANKAQLPETLVVQTAQETVARFREVWARKKKELPLAASVVRKIEEHVRRIPLIREIRASRKR